MRGLLIEDDQWKAAPIRKYIEETFPKVNLEVEGSFKGGLGAIFDYQFDFILLDMSLSSHELQPGNFSGKPKVFGGSDILKEMRRHKKTSRVKVITQYNEFDGGLISMSELHETLKGTYPDIYDGYILYIAGRLDWQKGVKEFIDSLSK